MEEKQLAMPRRRRLEDIPPFIWFREFRRYLSRRFRSQGRIIGAAVLVGLVAGLGAILFCVACEVASHYMLGELAGYHAEGPVGEARLPAGWLAAGEIGFRPWMLLFTPAIAGLVSGYLVYRLAPEAEGHGTDAAIASYHYQQGRIRPLVPPVKLIASAITIGGGGSGGREGPIAQIGAGFGSMLGSVLRLRPADRRILVAAGIGAGVAAIFRAPLAGALFAAEVLYRSPEIEQEVLIPAGIASVVAYCTFGAAFGWDPLFAAGGLSFDNAWQLIPYLMLAIWMAILAMVYVRTLDWTHQAFRKVKLYKPLKPMFGGLLTGVVGLSLYFGLRQTGVADFAGVLNVFGAGYSILQDVMITGGDFDALETTLWVLLAVAFGKIVTTSLTIGSGGSGGVFGPSMVIGGCGGAALGIGMHMALTAVRPAWISASVLPQPASFLIVGMAGFFAAAAKTPFSTLAIVCEMTGSYDLLLPALWVCTLSFLLSDQNSLYGWQVESRSRSPAHQGAFAREVLADLRVIDLVDSSRDVPILHPEESLTTVLDKFSLSDHHVLPVMSDDRQLLGVLVLDEMHDTPHDPMLDNLLLVADAMRPGITPLGPGDSLERALELFADQDLAALPVYQPSGSAPVQMVRRVDITSTYLRRMHGRTSTPAELVMH